MVQAEIIGEKIFSISETKNVTNKVFNVMG